MRLKPYNSLNLKEILINDENLVDISFFDLKPIGIVHNNFGYRLCPSTNLDNSTYWLFLEIIKLVLKNKKKFYIRLDPVSYTHLDVYKRQVQIFVNNKL